jgi:hypothetical protein
MLAMSLTSLHTLLLQHHTIDQKAYTGAYRRYRLVGRLVDLAGGMNYDDCPTCVLGGCALHIDGNSKLYTWLRSFATRRAPCGYEELPGDSALSIPDW